RRVPQVGQRIDSLGLRAEGRLADALLEVEVRPLAAAGAAELPDHLSGVDPLPEMHRGRLQHVHGDEALVVCWSVDGELVAAAPVIRVAVLPAIDHDAVVYRDL